MRLGFLTLAAAGALLCIGGCEDVQRPTALDDKAHAPNLQVIACQAHVDAGTVECARPMRDGSSLKPLFDIVGGQGVNVLLTSSNVQYDAGTEVFSADVTVQNLMSLTMGTQDGSAVTGVRVFFHTGPTVTGGSGSVSVRNADGTGTFTAANQPYHEYAQMLGTDETTSPKTWEWDVSSTVQNFAFEVYVETDTPDRPPTGLYLREEADDAYPHSFYLWNSPGRTDSSYMPTYGSRTLEWPVFVESGIPQSSYAISLWVGRSVHAHSSTGKSFAVSLVARRTANVEVSIADTTVTLNTDIQGRCYRKTFTLDAANPILAGDKLVLRVQAVGDTEGIMCYGEDRPAYVMVPGDAPITRVTVASLVTTDSMILALGEEQDISNARYDRIGDRLYGPRIDWFSSDPSVATVTSSGSVTGEAAGHATITAAVHGEVETTGVAVFDQLKWEVDLGSGVRSTPALATDGTIYVSALVGAMTAPQGSFHALNPDGTEKWQYTASSAVYSSPAVAADGTIYVGSRDKKLHAINPDGSSKWTFPTGGTVGTPAIASDGTVYAGSSDGNLYAIDPDGAKQWQFGASGAVWSPSIAADGTIYAGSSVDTLYAVNADGSAKWRFPLSGTPAIAADGTLYIGKLNSLVAINPDGSIKWQSVTDTTERFGSPSIGTDGTIYIGSTFTFTGSGAAKFYAVNPDGSLKWFFVPTMAERAGATPAVGDDGTVYFASCGLGYSPETDYRVFALNADGTLQWHIYVDACVSSGLAIGADGTVYAAGKNFDYFTGGGFYALKSSSTGLANSPWPKYRRDGKNTGRVN